MKNIKNIKNMISILIIICVLYIIYSIYIIKKCKESYTSPTSPTYPSTAYEYGPTVKNILCDDNGELIASPLIPPRLVAIWSGSSRSIPDGWQLCNGTNGSPDLRSRFVMGSNTNTDLNTSGGIREMTLTDTQMPEHNHNPVSTFDITKFSVAKAGNHAHVTDRAYSGITDTEPTDRFMYKLGSMGSSGGSGNIWVKSTLQTPSDTHTHTISYKNSNFTDDTIVNTTISNNAQMGTTRTPITNLPPYFVLAYIMKL